MLGQGINGTTQRRNIEILKYLAHILPAVILAEILPGADFGGKYIINFRTIILLNGIMTMDLKVLTTGEHAAAR